MPAADAMTVRWQTAEVCGSVVRYGTDPSALDKTAASGDSTMDHEVRLTGLTPSTTYYYSVGTSSGALAGGTADFHFKTWPAAGVAPPLRVWVLGDSGTGGDGTGRAEKVRDAYYKLTDFKEPDVWLMLGDNAYGKGGEDEVTRSVFGTYGKMLRVAPLWSTFGNHDTYTERGKPYFEMFTFPQHAECGGLVSGTERYYSFDCSNVHFISLDSEGDRKEGSPMFRWLEADLAANRRHWIIAFWHLPPYSKGSHDSDTERALGEMRRATLPILEKHGADLVLAGHSHSYERSMLIDGHYGTSLEFDPETMALNSGNGRADGPGATGVYTKTTGAHKGTVYVVGGNSGKKSGGKLDHPAMTVSKNEMGSIVLDIDGDRLKLREIGADGMLIDSFEIVKTRAAGDAR